MKNVIPEMDSKSMDIVADNISKLKELFPESFTEGKVDFDVLKEVLGNYIDGREERYSFTWNGKSKARMLAQTPSTGTLRPSKEESVDWDSTQNLFIEGDNLEVLKLLQKSYHKKVKMIYIDPPYNTGGDLIYKDDFSNNIKNYKEVTGQVDGEGRNLSSNPETSGRYHTDWLNMMYPRLKLARNLIDSDGIICVSISDHESSNLQNIMNEIFGEENYINTISVLSKVAAGASGGGEDKRLKKNIEYIYIYAKDANEFNTLSHMYRERPLLDVISDMRDEGESWKYTSILKSKGVREKVGVVKDGDGNPIEIYKINNIERTTISKVMKEEGITEEDAYKKYFDGIFSDTNAQTSIRQRVIDFVGSLGDGELLEVEYIPRSGRDKGQKVTHSYISNTVRRVIWLKDVAEIRDGVAIKKEKVGTLWDDFDYNNVGREDGVPYPNGKKPISLVERCLDLYEGSDFTAMDFFAGSGTLASAIQRANERDDGRRKYILVQLPEKIDLKSKDNKAALDLLEQNKLPPLLSELSKLRLKSINSQNLGSKQDLGFKVFKLDSTNIKPWELDFDLTEQDLEDQISNIKQGRKEEDVLYEVLLKYGLDLTLPITEHSVAGHKVFDIGMGALMICLSDDITLDVVEGIAKLKGELNPEIMRVVFKDAGFADDVVKTNAVQILKQAGIEDVRSL
ncbi:site-specific DNA-methyltransferase [Citrobacter sp. Igbk 14]|uniref:site-specific DNA-methyltransferase n=1 Tax=Citrobacter sp. Igbk 14 TaxID=2963960 RepID=UPI00107CBFB2|nr:site-specific DNA-methyltransferase [Citrobacter sp. Igbk 14]MDA8513689.1 site-specific DNA-methyltransferase [Citrobacter sp. Igbk 14]